MPLNVFFVLLEVVTVLFLVTTFAISVIVTTVAITITVAIAIAIAVTLAAIAIAVTLFGLDAIDNDIELQVAVLKVLDNAAEGILVGHALTDNEEVGIGMAHKQQGISDQGDGRRIDDDVFVAFLQLGKQLVALV